MPLLKQIYNFFNTLFKGNVLCPHCGHTISIRGISLGRSLLLCQKCRTKFQYYSIMVNPCLLYRKFGGKLKYRFYDMMYRLKYKLSSIEVTEKDIATITFVVIVLICAIFTALSFIYNWGWVLIPIRF